MATINQLHDDVQSAFLAALKCADSMEKRTLAEVEAELWTMMLALGADCVVPVSQAGRVRPAAYEHDGRHFVLAQSWRSTLPGIRVGKVAFRRPVGRRVGSKAAQADLLLDRELGLCGGFRVLAASRSSVSIVAVCIMPSRTADGRNKFPSSYEFSEKFEWIHQDRPKRTNKSKTYDGTTILVAPGIRRVGSKTRAPIGQLKECQRRVGLTLRKTMLQKVRLRQK